MKSVLVVLSCQPCSGPVLTMEAWPRSAVGGPARHPEFLGSESSIGSPLLSETFIEMSNCHVHVSSDTDLSLLSFRTLETLMTGDGHV